MCEFELEKRRVGETGRRKGERERERYRFNEIDRAAKRFGNRRRGRNERTDVFRRPGATEAPSPVVLTSV